MTGALMKNTDYLRKNRESRPADYGVENALASLLREEFEPSHIVERVAAFFRVSDGQARGAVYGTASRTTINEMVKSRNGGWRLWIALGEKLIGPLSEYIEAEARGAEIERRQWDARQEHLERLEARLRAPPAERPGFDR